MFDRVVKTRGVKKNKALFHTVMAQDISRNGR